MSYCRWSSMNSMCDVYVYEHVDGGWVTHVAGRRRIFPPIPTLSLRKTPKWLARVWMWSHRLHMWSGRFIPMRDIGLPHDGKTFRDTSPLDCAMTLEMLSSEGYRVPRYAIDALIEESERMEAST